MTLQQKLRVAGPFGYPGLNIKLPESHKSCKAHWLTLESR